jgi:hypothetical protein
MVTCFCEGNLIPACAVESRAHAPATYRKSRLSIANASFATAEALNLLQLRSLVCRGCSAGVGRLKTSGHGSSDRSCSYTASG